MENEIEVVDLKQELAVFDPVAAAVTKAKEECANIVLCYDTPDEIKEARSFIYRLRQLKAPINEVHKLQKAAAKSLCDALDGRRNTLICAVDSMIEEKFAPIREIEEAETLRLAENQLRVQREEEEKQEKARLELEAREKAVWDEREALEKEKAEIKKKVREARIALDAKRQAEADAKQALIDAEDKARQDAINAENARKQAIVDADNAKAAAVQKAKDDAVAEAQEKERLAIEAQEREREERVLAEHKETERINDDRHCSQIHRAICLKLMEDIDKQAATVVTQALIDGKIPHVTINY